MNRKNKSKQELLQEAELRKAAKRKKDIVRAIFPVLLKEDTIYDMQTTIGTIAGLIEQELQRRANETKMENFTCISPDIKDDKLREQIVEIEGILFDQNAVEVADTMVQLSQVIERYGARQFTKQPPDKLDLEAIV